MYPLSDTEQVFIMACLTVGIPEALGSGDVQV